MASEQSSQSSPPPAWPQPADPPGWADDPLGTGPRLPRPQDVSQAGGAGQTSPGNGWQAAMAQGDDVFRRQAPDPRTPRPQAPDARRSGDQSGDSPPGGDSWRTGVPGSGSWQQAFGAQPPADPQAPGSPPGGEQWRNGPPSRDGSRESDWNAASPTSPASGTGWHTEPGATAAMPVYSPSPTNPPGANPGPLGRRDPLTDPDPFNRDPLSNPDPFGARDPFRPSPEGGLPGSGPQPGGWAQAAGAPPEAPAHPAPGRNGPGQGMPPQGMPGHGMPGQAGQPFPGGGNGGPQQDPRQGAGQPGGHLSRDPSDPNRPFVTAGQISGPKTPPPERQQELWDTVFGDNYQAMGDEDDLEGRGRPVWIYALAGSAVVALVGVVLWAFLAGPLASGKDDPETAAPQTKPSAAAKNPAKSRSTSRLPRFPGKASPVSGTLSDQAAAISVPRLGGPWRLDQRPAVQTSYGFDTRQYVPAGSDTAGKPQFAQVMSGPLSARMKSKYVDGRLAPVINAVASAARGKFFPQENTARKIAQQTLKVGGHPAQLAAYEITAGETKTTMVVAAVNTGAQLPSVVYMSVPDGKKELLPDINTVFTSIKPAAS
ncbi:hypothetical protein AB0D67_28975 [Streptosporangium sp. NPDC048047]|uniref:hypothetical protein n=1 Tax=Streptosporangium sp. NPDC048047 TaxID=3155748 RepID=UPI00341F3FAB